MLVPKKIDNEEKLGRAVYYPKHIKNNIIKPAAFRPPNNKNTTSVQRLKYCTLSECHKIGNEEITKGAFLTYMGIGVIMTKIVRNNGLEVKSNPDNGNKAHADIIFNHTFIKSEAAPPEIQLILRNLAKSTEFIKYEKDETS